MKGLVYKDPRGDTPGTFADWLRDLRKQSGAYVIRSTETKQPLYVGGSHTGALYRTITRHFQRWTETKGWFSDQVPVPRTYSRHHVEVAVRLTPPGAAIGCQNNLIGRLDPRDNELGKPADKPF